jgi:hypothetical protein
MLTSGEQIFIVKDIVYPAETAQAQIMIASVGHIKKSYLLCRHLNF